MKRHTQDFKGFSLNEANYHPETSNAAIRIYKDGVEDELTGTRFFRLIYSLGLNREWSDLKGRMLDAISDKIDSGELQGFIAASGQQGGLDAKGAVRYMIDNDPSVVRIK